MGLGIYRQCKLPWLFCKEIHNPQRLSRSNAPAQKTEQNSCVLDPSPCTLRGWRMHPQQDRVATLSSLPPLLIALPRGSHNAL